MRIVLDTVVFLRALINPRSRWGYLIFDLSDQYTLVLSPAIIEEILDVLYRPFLRRRFPQIASPPELQAVLQLLQMAEVVEPKTQLKVCRDPADDKFLECALEGQADYIISEDKDLLEMDQLDTVKIRDVAELFRLLGKAEA